MESHFSIDYRYDPGNSFARGHERDPIMVAWTTVPQVDKHAAAFHRHHWNRGIGAVRVTFPFAKDQAWPHDASVRFVLLTATQSSEGKWTWAKTASGKAHLATLLANAERTSGGSTSNYDKIEMQVQSYYMPPPGKDAQELVDAERHKGNLYVRMTPGSHQHLSPQIRWQPANAFDLTPANEANLQAAMMMAVSRNMAPFSVRMASTQTSSSRNKHGGSTATLSPTLPEIYNVHAPFYVQETEIPLDGAAYWSRTPYVAYQHIHHHGGTRQADAYLGTLLSQSLARHNMSAKRFVEAANVFEMAHTTRITSSVRKQISDAQLNTAVAVVATACTMRVNMMRYVADKVYLSQSKTSTVVESFDQVDLRTDRSNDTGGVHSTSLGGRTASRYFSGQTIDTNSSDSDKASGGSMDCEDGGKDAAVHFVLLADSDAGLPTHKIRSDLVHAARKIARHYRAVGVLCSVLSRNLADARGGQSSPPSQASVSPKTTAAAATPVWDQLWQDEEGRDDTQKLKPVSSPFGPHRQRKTSVAVPQTTPSQATIGAEPIEEELGHPIGSPQDRRVEVGAHMFTLLIPQRVLQKQIQRGLASKRASDQRVDLGHMRTAGASLTTDQATKETENLYLQMPASSPLSRGRDLPIALCEGTGILHPLMLPAEHYMPIGDLNTRAGVMTHAVMDQEAQVRLRTGKTSQELAAWIVEQQQQQQNASNVTVIPVSARGASQGMRSSSTTPPPSVLELFVPMHQQDQLVDHPDQRIVRGFYRTAAEMYLVPPKRHLDQRLQGNGTDGSGVLVGDRLIPVQIGDRNRVQGNTRSKVTWGVAVSDILRQHPFVGLLPTPHPSPTEDQIVDRVHAQIAPAVSLHLDQHFEQERDVQDAHAWSDALRATRLPSVASALKRLDPSTIHDRYVLVHGYAHTQDLQDETKHRQALVAWLADQNPHVVAADLVVERSTYKLATVRLDALVDCGDTIREARPRIEATLRQRALSPLPASASFGFPQLPVGSCGMPHHGSFVPIMRKHIQLTIDYVIASWEHHDPDNPSDLPLTHPTVQALVAQFQEWSQAINGRVDAEGMRAYRAGFNAIVDPNHQYMAVPPPGQLWSDQLILNHTVFAKHVADAAWYPDIPAQVEKKKTALANITGTNNDRIGDFWGFLMPDPYARGAVRRLWMSHLVCTAAYIDKLRNTNDPNGAAFHEKTAKCLEEGRQFGALLDAHLPDTDRFSGSSFDPRGGITSSSSRIGETKTIRLSVSANGRYLLNGEEAPEVDLPIHRTGVLYRFVFDRKVASGNHPLYFTTSPVGNAGGQGSVLRPEKLDQIRTAVLNAQEAGTGGVFTIDPRTDMDPDVWMPIPGAPREHGPKLYYQCAVHPKMGGRIIFL
jgi:hypothetical protein